VNLRARRLAQVGACLLVLTAAACGNRLSEQEILAKNTSSGSGTLGGATGTGQGGNGTSVLPGQGTGGLGGTGTTTGSGGTGTVTGASGGTGSATGTSSGTGAGAGTGSTAGKPIVVGFIGALSGAGGVFVTPMRDAWLAWAKMVNAQGGINGHPVKVLVGDDGINDQRGLQIAHSFVAQGAIALSWSSNDVTGIANYAKEKHFPVIGTQTSQAIWNESPYMFPMGPGGNGAGWGADRAVRDAGATKLAVFYCVEAQASCKGAADQVVAHASEAGVQVVYEAGVSITQPDYTAECLQAQSDGAQATIVFVDQNSMIRFAQSCHRQGYKPVIIGSGGDSMTKVADVQGMLTMGGEFPWFARTGSPGIVEYAQALQKYAPNLLTAGNSAQTAGWLSAKIFQAAATAKIGRGVTPTGQLALDGLWTIKNDTFGGLAPGPLARTFNTMKPTPDVFCTFVVKLDNGTWSAQNHGAPECR
jgi:branched-chain amino acid transport system substrate-binding protein